MKTIEERAWEKYPEVIKYHNLARIDINEKKRKMYIEIVTDQKEADIDKACDWLKERVQCGVHPQRAYGFAEEFRKAMEK